MPDKNVLPASQSPFAQRAQRQPAPVQQPRVAPGQPDQPQTPGRAPVTPPQGTSQAEPGSSPALEAVLATLGLGNLGEWQGRIKNAKKSDELNEIVAQLTQIKSRVKSAVNPTVTQGLTPTMKVPTAQPSPFARAPVAAQTPATLKGVP